ncbi:type II secretion system protein [Opitutaceae bacterium TAV4]|nr:type II secretion system protein [Opitutaceae bacterium TAV4]RRK02082.1 type II secretion system protein [Opitutaceae bacterium TAV3]
MALSYTQGMYHRSRYSGFTLIELLTVIAIIGVLAALIIPTVGLVRKKARASASISNLRQIHLAFTLFADDHRDHYPTPAGVVPWKDNPADGDELPWAQQLFPYTQSKEIFITPTFERMPGMCAYFMSVRAAAQATGSNTLSATVRSRVQFPAQHVLVGETNLSLSEPDFDKDDYGGNSYVGGNNLMPYGKQAILFVDGHVATFDQFDATKMTFRYDSLSAY